MKKIVLGLLALVVATSPVSAAGLKLAIGDGKVSIDAQDVTVRQIMTEWARLGKTRIVNLEGVASAPMTLILDNVPESVALDIILRAVPGYMAAARSSYLPGASTYDRILIMATVSAPVAGNRQAGTTFQAPPAFQPPAYSPNQPNVTQLRSSPSLTPGVLPEPDDDQRDDPAIAAAAAAGLVTVPPISIGGSMLPGLRPPNVEPAAPASPAAAPANPWNITGGASLPGLAPPAPPPAAPPVTGIRRPPQADR